MGANRTGAMSRVARMKPRPPVLVALLALVVAVAGTAVAGPLAGKSVLSKKEKKQTRNIATNIVNQSAPGLSVAKAANADALNGVTEPLFTVGRSGSDDSCSAGLSFTDCVGVDLSLPRSGRVLVIAAGGQVSDAGTEQGDCQIEVDDSPGPVPGGNIVAPGEDPTDNTDGGNSVNGFAITATTNVLPAGTHTFELSCDDDDVGPGEQFIQDSSISAVMVGSS
jgi:hypothetical protein